MLFVVHHDFHIIYFRLCRVYIFLISHELVFCNIGVETKERKKITETFGIPR